MSPEKKFKNVSIESDTIFHAIKYLNLDSTDCRYEFWEWDGVEAKSLIFCTPELKEVTELYFQKLIGLVGNTTAAEPGKFTSKSNPEYTYLNFNFTVK